MNDYSDFGSPHDSAPSADGNSPQNAMPVAPQAPRTAISAEDREARLNNEIDESGPAFEEPAECVGSVGRTSFDLPSSKDNLLVVLVRREDIEDLPSQALVEIRPLAKERGGDGRTYRGVVVAGPFYEPDGLRGDAPVLVTTGVRGAMFMPRYHGRVMVEVIGEFDEGRLVPPRRRPLPNSPVFVMGEEETAQVLGIVGENHGIVVGTLIGHEELEVRYPSSGREGKAVLPRHTGFIGTTGGGKSTSVSKAIFEWQQTEVATVLIDTEGEYTSINEPTEDRDMIRALERRGQKPVGIPNTHLYYLVGNDPSNPAHPNCTPFSLPFDQLAPDLVMEILELSPAQQAAYEKAYEITRSLILALKLYGTTDKERRVLMDLDELEQGFPTMRLAMVRDVVEVCAKLVAGDLDDDGKPAIRRFYSGEFARNQSRVISAVEQANPKTAQRDRRSWFTVLRELNRYQRLGIFDHPKAQSLNFDMLTTPGRVSIIDLGDTDSPRVNNLTIAEILRGTFNQQNANYEAAQAGKEEMRRVVVVIEEAHEFLSAERVKQMPVLFQQVARIARRGRKRWLGLAFVTQLPQHLPNEVLGLINNYILHKITDENVVGRMKRLIGTIDEGLWSRLPTLIAGQAVVRMESMSRPLLVAMDPTPCKLRMVD